MRGHGRSDSPAAAAAYSKAMQVADIAAVLDAARVETAVLCGHSMGGYDAMLFLLARPERVQGLILYGTGPGFAGEKGLAAWNATADKMAVRAHTLPFGARPP